jgi:outer membrane lipoprotein SlyB
MQVAPEFDPASGKNDQGASMSTTPFDSTTTAKPAASAGLFGGRFNRNALLVAGGLALAGLGVAAGLTLRAPAEPEIVAPGSVQAAKASLAANESLVEPAKADKVGTPVPLADEKAVAPHVDAKTAEATAKPSTHAATKRAGTTASRANTSGTGTSTQTAAVCTRCGMVESVQAVTVKGKGTGVGAVAGGAVGAVVGNQFGHGNGRAAMTVLGAIGGGLAGNEIEKRSKAETYYDVRVRMDDGTVRTIRQKSAPATGSRVTVDNGVVRAATQNA